MRERNTFPIREVAAAALLMAGATAAQSATLGLYISGPGVQQTEITGAATEDFENFPTGALAQNATGPSPLGSYTVTGDSATINNAGIYGGAGGTGKYFFSGNGATEGIEFALPAGTKYVGFWWSAGSPGNQISVHSSAGGPPIATLDTALLNSLLPNDSTQITAINSSQYTTSQYYGNPNPNNSGAAGEQFVYIHLALSNVTGSEDIGKISFDGTNLEIDNVSIAATLPTDLPNTWVKVVEANPDVAYVWNGASSLTGDAAANDGESGSVTYSLPSGSATDLGGSVTLTPAGEYTYTPTANTAWNLTNPDTFTYQVCATSGALCSTATVTIYPASLVDDSESTPFNTNVNINLLGNDSLPFGYTISGTTQPSNGTVTPGATPGTYTYNPNDTFSGTDTFTYTVCPPGGSGPACDTATVTILVGPNAVDDGPYPATTTTGSVISNDDVPSDSTPTSYEVTASPTTGGTLVIDPDNGGYTYTPPTDYAGVEEFSYTITVGDANSGPAPQTATATITFIVPPQANGGTGTTTVGTPTTVALPNEVWPANPGLTSTPSVNGGTVSFDSSGVATYTPAPGFGGIDTVEYQVCLPAPNATVCDTSTITVTVTPTAADKSITGSPNTPISEDLTPENPSAPNGATYEVVTRPTNGNVTLNPDGSFTYTPDSNWHGNDSFTYRICVGTGANKVCSDPATVSINVNHGQIANVPTMSVGGLLAMSGLLGGMAAFVRRRKKSN